MKLIKKQKQKKPPKNQPDEFLKEKTSLKWNTVYKNYNQKLRKALHNWLDMADKKLSELESYPHNYSECTQRQRDEK